MTQNTVNIEEILGGFYGSVKSALDSRINSDTPGSGQAYKSSDTQSYLDRSYIENMNELLQLPANVLNEVSAAVETVNANFRLKSFLSLCHDLLFTKEQVDQSHFMTVGELKEEMGNQAALFPVLVLISNMNSLITYYKDKNIGRTVLQATLSDLEIWMNRCHNLYGVWGLKEFNWLILSFRGRLFRLGRLQYMTGRFEGKLKVFRSRKTGEVLALSEPDIAYRENGQVNGTNGIYDSENVYTAVHRESGDIIEGNAVLPNGRFQKDISKLSRQEWELVLSKGDPMIDLHIPEGQKLDHAACGESFKMAAEFFSRHFPEFAYKGFVCMSWLLDPQLQELLPESSNISKFQREFYLYPFFTDDAQTLERVFGFGLTMADMASFPLKTNLQKAVYDYIQQGHRMQEGSMFLLKEDLHWGSKVYWK